MARATCSSIREQLVSYLGSLTEATQARDICIITLPVKTADSRWVDVYVEPAKTANDYYIVHDGGKAFSELSIQGYGVTGTRQSNLVKLALQYGLGLDKGVITKGSNYEGLSEAIWAVAQCSFLASSELINERSAPEDAAIYNAVAQTVERWGLSRNIPISRNMTIMGNLDQHRFDFVASASTPIAVSLLSPASGALAQAQRYGFHSLDLKGTKYQTWKKVAVLDKPTVWTAKSLSLIAGVSDRYIRADSAELIREPLREALDAIAA